MNQTDYTTSNTQLSKNTIFYLNSNLTKKGKSLLIALYKYQSLKHKDLAEILDTRANALTNLITRINKMQKDFILSDSVGRCKFYSLSQIAEAYTEIVLLPKETARNSARTSCLQYDFFTCDVLNFLGKFQEYEGDDWYIVLDDLLFTETQNRLTASNDSKGTFIHSYMDFKEETYQNYTNLKDAFITLIVQHGKQSAEKIYRILDEKILSKRLDFLLSLILNDYYKIEPLFYLEKKDSLVAYSIIDSIFSEYFPEVFGKTSFSYSDLSPAEYYRIYSVIIQMINEFKENGYDKSISIKQWEKNFHTTDHSNCLSYIAEKCSTIHIRHIQ